MLLSALVLAIKYSEDKFYRNEFYARIGGISRKELNSLEKEMLSMLDFDLFVSETVYETYVKEIQAYFERSFLSQKETKEDKKTIAVEDNEDGESNTAQDCEIEFGKSR